jgi:CDGSH-type Zn-finger protein
MARLVKHVRNEPYEVKVEGAEKSVWICACGLSQDKPYCDGSHKRARDEGEGEIYLYDAEGRVQAPVGY